VITVTRTIALEERELTFEFVRSSGPGGQNVNKVATAVQLRFGAMASSSLPAYVKERLPGVAGRRLTSEGVIVIDARRYRTQERNREDAIQRLIALLKKAAARPRRRRATAPTRASQERRITAKKQRGKLKRDRGGARADAEE
jgi:ribosome-associated protein